MRAIPLVLALMAGGALAAEQSHDVQLRASAPAASKCIAQKAQNDHHYTKTTGPTNGEHQVVVYEGASSKDTKELGTVRIVANGRGARASVAAQDWEHVGPLLTRWASGC